MDLVQVIVSGILIGSIYSLVSVGLTLIFGVLNIINFAHGSYLMIGMYVAYYAWSVAGLDPLIGIVVGAVVLAAAGWLTYWLVIRRLIGKSPLAQIISTFGILVALQGLAQVAFGPNDRAVANPVAGRLNLNIGQIVVTGPQLAGFLGAVLFTCLVALLINRTEVGTAIRATGEDRGAAALMGINVRRVDALTWAIGLSCVGIAGALLVNSYPVDPNAGVTFGVIAFFAVALGGFGSIVGASIAGIILGVAQNVAALYAPQYALVALVGIYLVIVLIRPQGLLGTR